MGYSTLKTCTLDIASYLDAETAPLQKFYDLYLVDADGALVPTVTKLINYRDSRSREFVNVDSNDGADLTDEQFTGRFFLYDRVSSLQSAGAAQPRVLRYPKSVKLTITVTNLGQPPSIFVPIVTIEYGTIEVDAISERIHLHARRLAGEEEERRRGAHLDSGRLSRRRGPSSPPA